MGHGMSYLSNGKPRKGWVGQRMSQVSSPNHRWDRLCPSPKSLMRPSLSRETVIRVRGGNGFGAEIAGGEIRAGDRRQSIPCGEVLDGKLCLASSVGRWLSSFDCALSRWFALFLRCDGEGAAR